jgi:hypothetical protein
MPPRKPAPTADQALAQVCAYTMMVLGALIAGYLVARAAGDAPPPGPLTAAGIITGALEMGLGAGLLYKRRPAWAFAVSLNWSLFVVGALSMKAMITGGVPLVACLSLVMVLLVLGILLTIAQGAFRS